MNTRLPRAWRTLALLVLIMLCVPCMSRPAAARDASRDPVILRDEPDLARMKRARLMREATEERRERREIAREAARAAKLRARRAAPRGARVVPLPEGAGQPGMRTLPGAAPAGITGLSGIPTNVLVNNRSGDASNSAQSEQSIAISGNFGLCTWNNGQGFVNATDTQGAAYTLNGGATWTQVAIPHPAGAVANFWYTDPVVTLNEKTGEFYYTAITRPNGLCVIKATFPGGVFTWGTPVLVRNDPTTNLLFDKPWIAADSLSGNLYLSYTTFGFSDDSILFQRSTDKGVHWGDPMLMNVTPLSFGAVQGSRPAVGDSGQVYVVWQELGFIDLDYIKVRKSPAGSGGQTFFPEDTVAREYSNDGTGAPGFNRPNGLTFPAIAVDRSKGPYRGRVYVCWNESVDFFDDTLGTAGAKSEVEGNNTFATATPFNPGMKLRGNMAAADVDFWRFEGSQGKTYVFYCDSLGPTLKYEMRIYCTDQVATLAYAGAPDAFSAGEKTQFCWTAPDTGTYYLQIKPIGTTSLYRIQTGINQPTVGEHARDQRDVFAAYARVGLGWSSPWRMNDEPGRYDDWLPEIAVGSDGYVYSLWYDWRDAPASCGGASNLRASRSIIGGTAWEASTPVTTIPTAWSSVQANVAPNQGDYNAIQGGPLLAAAWADGRLGNPDVVMAKTGLGHQLVSCAHDTTVRQGNLVQCLWTVTNQNALFDNTYQVTLTNTRHWPMPASGPVVVRAGTTMGIYREVIVPDTAKVGATNSVCFTIANLNNTASFSCCINIGVQAGILDAGPAPAAFALHGAVPNPAVDGLHVSFSLPDGAPARLEVIDLGGRRIVSRDVGGLGAGGHVLDLGRDAAGAPPGVYWIRLTRGGRALTTRVALMR